MEKLLEILNKLYPDVDFENNDSLVENMIIDSLGMTTLVTEIYNAFEIKIPAADIVPDNFNSAETIMALINRLDEE